MIISSSADSAGSTPNCAAIGSPSSSASVASSRMSSEIVSGGDVVVCASPSASVGGASGRAAAGGGVPHGSRAAPGDGLRVELERHDQRRDRQHVGVDERALEQLRRARQSAGHGYRLLPPATRTATAAATRLASSPSPRPRGAWTVTSARRGCRRAARAAECQQGQRALGDGREANPATAPALVAHVHVSDTHGPHPR